MTQFHEGQSVEVAEYIGDPRPFRVWRKAKIVRMWDSIPYPTTWQVEFINGARAIIRSNDVRTPFEVSI